MAVTDVFVDTVKALPEQFLDVLEVTQKMILSNVAAVAESTKSLTPVMPSVPFAERMPDPIGVTEGAFEFFEKVWASQRDFSLKLLATYLPAKGLSETPAEAKVAVPTKAPAAKAAKPA